MNIVVDFEDFYQGSLDKKGTTIEWPPSPFRLYKTLVDAAYRRHRQGEQDRRGILQWFESLQPPRIFVGNYEVNYERRRWVMTGIIKNSDSDKAIIQKNDQIVSPMGPVVFQWDGVDDHPGWNDIAHLAEWVVFLGTRISQCQIRVMRDMPEVTFRYCYEPSPVPGCVERVALRVPSIGSLDALDDEYARGFAATFQPLRQVYSKVSAARHRRSYNSIWNKTYTFGLDRDTPITYGSSLAVSFRHKVGEIARAKGLVQLADELLGASHLAEKEHLAFVPLPDFLHTFSKFEIKGISVCLPHALSFLAEDLATCLCGLENFVLKHRGEDLGLVQVHETRGLRTTSPDTWSGTARKWGSVVPILGYRYKNTERTARKTISFLEKEISRRNLPVPKSIVAGECVAGCRGPKCSDYYFDYRKSTEQMPKWFYHAVIEFQEKVTIDGPLVLGRASNFGCGLFSPLAVP